MIEQLFGSKTRVKLLRLFYSNPNRSFYVREITRKIDEQINSVRRELGNLLSVGIIVSVDSGNKLYYEVNQKFEYYKPLQEIFGESAGAGAKKSTKKKAKTPAGADDTAAADSPASADLQSIGRVELALYTGQFTRDESAGIDFLVVGDVNKSALKKYVSDLEAREGKSIRYATMKLPEFQYRLAIKDRFASAIEQAKKQILIDENNLLS